MTLRSIGLGLFISASFGLSALGQTRVDGVVFEDRNENGIRETAENGIAGVVVSNQIDCVATGDDGAYQIDMAPGFGILFVSVPATHRTVGPFWRDVGETSNRSVDFALTPAPPTEEFTFIHASDTHLSEKNLSRLHQLRNIVVERKPAFVLITGDLIEDALRVPEQVAVDLYELYRREIESFPAPVYNVPGNHEIFGIERHHSLVGKDHPLYGRQMYRKYLGPDYYSFQFGQVRFIGLNSLDYDDLWYYGHFDPTQLEWLDRSLSRVPAGSVVVTFGHVPLLSTVSSFIGFGDDRFIDLDGERTYRHTVSNAEDLMGRLTGFRHTLSLAGHIHYREKLELEGIDTRFHHAPAVRGPNATNAQMPSGVILYRVKGGEVDDGEFIPLDKGAIGR